VLSLSIAAGIPLRWPRPAVVPLLVAAGFLTGAAFPDVAARCSREARAGAGKGFAADAAGAAASALAVGLIALPWAGMAATALALGAVLAAAAVAAGWSESAGSG
jgi:predicted membrane-bound spermidine synthase